MLILVGLVLFRLTLWICRRRTAGILTQSSYGTNHEQRSDKTWCQTSQRFPKNHTSILDATLLDWVDICAASSSIFGAFVAAILQKFCFNGFMGLIIRSSTIHAAGCYTTAPIAKGTRVVEYTGPLIDKDQADLRYEGRPITYLFGIGDGTRVIDGHGTAMFINHSCDANCETEEIEERVWIMAVRDIAAGEELCYDYCLYDGDEEEATCNCGAQTCRGSMFSPEELQRRKRLARKTAAKSTDVKAEKRRTPRKKQAKEASTQQKRQAKSNKSAVETKKKAPAGGNSRKKTRR